MNTGADLKEAKKTLFDEYLIILKYEFNKAKLKYKGKAERKKEWDV